MECLSFAYLAESAKGGAKTQALHWGHNWFEKNGWGGHLRHSWYCGHYFRYMFWSVFRLVCTTEFLKLTLVRRSLCNEHRDHPNEYYAIPWYNHRRWLDYSERLAEAHKTDEQRETVFHEAVQELRAKVTEDRKDK
jgi:hypothetical protein